MSELTTSRTAADDERSSLFKEAERLKVEKAVLEARIARLEQEAIELKGQRGDVKAEGSLMLKKEFAKLEAQWQLKYDEIESSKADMLCAQDRTIALLQQQLNKAWATIEEADSTWFGECVAEPDDPVPPGGGSH